MPNALTPVAIITGAGSGIGLATAKRLDAQGYSTVLAGRTIEPLQSLASTLTNRALVVPTNIADPDQCRSLIHQTLQAFSRVDVLVNNAGSGTLTPIETWTPQDFLDAFALNALGPAILIREIWQTFTTQKAGLVINITSMSVVDPFPGLGPYAAAKSALASLTRSIKNEGDALGIKSFEIAPGAVETKLLRTLVDTDALPTSQTLNPDDIAIVIEELVTGKRTEPNGSQIIVPSGQQSAHNLNA